MAPNHLTGPLSGVTPLNKSEEKTMRIGDVSRPRRFANLARQRWYAYHRSVRFAMRMLRPEATGAEGTKTPAEQNLCPEPAGPTTLAEVLDRLAAEVAE
jgi:hypothetical protein